MRTRGRVGRRLLTAITAAALTIGVAGMGQAAALVNQNDLEGSCGAIPGQLVADCGFENGVNLSGWTPGGQVDAVTGVHDGGHTGNYSFWLANQEPVDTVLSTTVQTTPGEQYFFTYWIDHPETSGINHFESSVSGVQGPSGPYTEMLANFYNSGAAPFFGHFIQPIVAAGTSMTIKFGGYDEGGKYVIDDVTLAHRLPQAITFPALPDVPYGTTVTPGATTSSGMPVAYQTTGNCTMTNGKVTATGVGPCTLEAQHPGSPEFDPAASVTQTFQFTPAPLVVTAPSPTVYIGQPIPVLPPGYSGFVSPEGPADLSTPATCTTTATASSPAGTYPVTCSGASGPHYAISYVPGTLTISKVPTTTTVSVTPATPGFDQTVNISASMSPAFRLTQAPSGLVSLSIDGATVATAAAGSTVIDTTALGGGTHTVIASYGGDARYLASSSAALTVSVPCAETITGTHGPISYVGPGLLCVRNAQINGGISAGAGSIDIENSVVSGPLSIAHLAGVRICGSTTQSVIVSATGDFVLVGDPSRGCAANTITGTLSLTQNTHGVVATGNHVTGTVAAVGNSGASPFGDPAPVITANH